MTPSTLKSNVREQFFSFFWGGIIKVEGVKIKWCMARGRKPVGKIWIIEKRRIGVG